jgi:CRP-like cAMP-binding protein
VFRRLKQYCQKVVPFTYDELALIDSLFIQKDIGKKVFLLRDNEVCNFIAFIESGSIRHFHVKDGVEKTCDISFENSWVTEFQSFTFANLSRINLQAIEKSTLNIISKQDLYSLYKTCPKYETFGRLMAERVAQRASDIAMSLSADKPEERFESLLKNQPTLFQRIPQKYIANLLGISPESLSRMRSRIARRSKS